MTTVVVLIPGIMGSELTLGGTQVWPPTLAETQFGYDRVGDLMSSGVQVGDIIRSISCYPVYQSLIDQLGAWGYREPPPVGGGNGLLCWPYDWRLDIRTSATLLSQRLQQLVTDHGAALDVVLLPHSMGGLIARYALEVSDAKLGNTSWRANVTLLVTLATPHRGAPLALVRALGLEGTMGVSAADVKMFSADRHYPSSYQLIPPPEAFGFWNRYGGPDSLPAINVFDSGVASALGLTLDNIAAARDLYAALANGMRPPKCRYFNFIGRQLSTVVRGDFTAATTLVPVTADDGGDGTVPVWSGTLPVTQFELVGDEHARTFRNAQLLTTLGALLGVPPALMATTMAPAPVLMVSLPQAVFTAGTVARVTVQSTVTGDVPLSLTIYPVDELGKRDESAVSTIDIAQVPSGNIGLRVNITLPAQPGLYTIVPHSRDGTIEGPPEGFALQP